MLTIILFCFLGVFIGLFAGLLPGVHPNQIYITIIGLLPILSKFPEENLLALLISITVSNIFANYIPTIFFSIPESGTVINVLPGHRMVIEGKGLDALFISLSSAFLTIIFCIFSLPILLFLIPTLNKFFYPNVHFLLIGLAIWMIFLEKSFKKKILALVLYVLSGMWGIVCLNSPLINQEWVLFPTLTGMFGFAGILTSMGNTTKFPEQKFSEDIKIGNLKKIISSGIIAGLLIGIMPGAGESQAGVLVSQFTGLTQKEFLGSLSSINIGNAFFSLVSLHSLGKIRSGAAAAINEIIPEFQLSHLIFSSGVLLFSGGISVIMTWWIGKKSLSTLQNINYKKVTKIIIIFTALLVFLFTGFIGIFILLVSTCIGFLPLIWGVKRTNNMGFLMIPTIIYFSGFTWVVNFALF